MPEHPNPDENSHNRQQSHNINNNDNSGTKRIMIINDREDINFSIKTVLEESSPFYNYKIKVYPFTNPFLALEHFGSGLYDLVLVDIVMPEINGFELYYKIRKLDERVKICFLTASDLPEETRKQMFPDELDKICFIKMPIANHELVARIKEILKME